MKYLTPLVVHMHPMGIKQKLLQGIQDCTLSFHILCIKSIRTHTCIFTVGLTKQNKHTKYHIHIGDKENVHQFSQGVQSASHTKLACTTLHWLEQRQIHRGSGFQ